MLSSVSRAFAIQPQLALVSATSVCLASFVAFAMHLGAPWWAAISAWIVAHADSQRWWAKSSQRVIASLVGSFAGYHLALMTESDPVLQALCIFSLGTLGVYKRLTSPEHSYAWFLGALTAVIIMLTSIGSVDGLFNTAVERAVEVSVGVIIAGAVTGVYTLSATSPRPQPTETPISSSQPAIDRYTYNWILAITGGIALALTPVINGWIELPGLTQFAITIGVCLNGRSYEIQQIGQQRILGCLAGGAVGIGIVAMNIESLLLYLTLQFAFVYIVSGIHQGGSRWAAIGTQAGVAFMICTLSSSGPVDSILPVIHRFVGILCALVTVTGLTLLLRRAYLQFARPAQA